MFWGFGFFFSQRVIETQVLRGEACMSRAASQVRLSPGVCSAMDLAGSLQALCVDMSR